jgi:hypothetical protein
MLHAPTRMDPVDHRLRAGAETEPHTSTTLRLRRGVLAVSTLLAAVGLFWIGRAFLVDGQLRFGNPPEFHALAADTPDPQPRQVRAEVTRVSGASGVRPGDKCEFLVERRRRERDLFYCNAQIVCGGRLLFGGPDRGYFACRLFDDARRDVVGSEPSTTAADKDAALLINTREGVMRIWDDAHGNHGEFSIEAEILSIQ